ncbi:MAG TPA: hypothetical protein VNF47_01635 [Streptosporangiaceae bacterium]|nr:hypothetical protein [Streptosporangiaceae bacterium]
MRRPCTTYSQRCPVILLADALPGIPVDIDDAPRLQELLTALTAAPERAAR